MSQDLEKYPEMEVIVAGKPCVLRAVRLDSVIPNDWNPNQQNPEIFNRLVRDIEEYGFLQPFLAFEKPEDYEIHEEFPGDPDLIDYIIIDGEHRYEALRQLGSEKCVLVVAPGELSGDEIERMAATVRMNAIRGKNNINKMVHLMERIARERELDEAADLVMMEADEFEELIEQHRQMITDQTTREEFDRRVAAGEIKTVDDLSRVLNELFGKYGDTVPANFMVLDFGGKQHIWVRLDKSVYKQIRDLAFDTRAAGWTFDSLVIFLLSKMNSDKIAQLGERGVLTAIPEEPDEADLWEAEVPSGAVGDEDG